MSDYGISAYNDLNKVDLVDFEGALMVWSKTLSSASDVSGEYTLPSKLHNKCKLLITLTYTTGGAGDKFYRMDKINFNGVKVTWNMERFNAGGATNVQLVLAIIK